MSQAYRRPLYVPMYMYKDDADSAEGWPASCAASFRRMPRGVPYPHRSWLQVAGGVAIPQQAAAAVQLYLELSTDSML